MTTSKERMLELAKTLGEAELLFKIRKATDTNHAELTEDGGVRLGVPHNCLCNEEQLVKLLGLLAQKPPKFTSCVRRGLASMRELTCLLQDPAEAATAHERVATWGKWKQYDFNKAMEWLEAVEEFPDIPQGAAKKKEKTDAASTPE